MGKLAATAHHQRQRSRPHHLRHARTPLMHQALVLLVFMSLMPNWLQGFMGKVVMMLDCCCGVPYGTA